MAANFAQRCPDLLTISSQLQEIPLKLNSFDRGATLSKAQETGKMNVSEAGTYATFSWKSLKVAAGPKNIKYINILQKLARLYGYPSPRDQTPSGYCCTFTKIEDNILKYWDCFEEDAREVTNVDNTQRVCRRETGLA